MGRVAHTPQIPLCTHPILLKVQVVQCVAASKYPSNDVHIIEIINKKIIFMIYLKKNQNSSKMTEAAF